MKKIIISMLVVLFATASLVQAQNDVTKFLGIPVDGSKSEMIQKLKNKGYALSPYNKDALVGEFNGTDVYISIVTNNNKVCRIGVADVNTKNEANIRIRFNNLIQQFQNNKNYLSLPDSTILRYTIPEDENISYELSVNNKQYQALFYQKTADYDSLTLETDILLEKQTLNDIDIEQLSTLMSRKTDALYKCFYKTVWFNISERFGKYYIIIFYENEYNRANGEDL